MSYPVNQRVNPYQQQQQTQQQQQLQQNPAMGYGLNVNGTNPLDKINVDSQKVKDAALEKSRQTWIGRITESLASQNLTIGKAIICALGAVGVVFGASGAMNTFIRKGGMFKMGKVVDDFAVKMLKNKKIASAVNKSSKSVDALKTWFKKTDLGKLFSDNKNLLQPKNQMAAFMSKGTKCEAVDEITDVLKAMVNEGENRPKEYRGLFGIIRKNISNFMQRFPWEQNAKKVSESNLKKFKEIVKELPSVKKGTESVDDIISQILKVDDGGIDNKFAVYKKIEPALKKYFGYDIEDKAKLIEYLSKGQKGQAAEKIVQRVNIMGLTHKVDLGEAVKKVMILNGETAQTGLGKTAQIASLRSIEGVSNGVTSRSKMGLIMGLGIYWGIMKKIVNAPKGEKSKTAVDEVVQDMGGYMMLPVTAGVLYGAASLMNWGLKPGSFPKFSERAAELAKQYDNVGNNVSKVAIMEAYKKLAKETYSQGKWYQKLLRWPSQKILSAGLISKPSGFLSKFKNGFGGGALRFFAFSMIVSPLLMKPIITLSRAIFGKTTEVKKEEAELKAKKENKQQYPPLSYPDYNQTETFVQPQVQQIQPNTVIKPIQQYNNNLANNQVNTVKNENLINNSVSQREMIPTSESTKRRYIPSEEGIKIDYTKTDQEKSDRANTAINKSLQVDKVVSRYV